MAVSLWDVTLEGPVVPNGPLTIRTSGVTLRTAVGRALSSLEWRPNAEGQYQKHTLGTEMRVSASRRPERLRSVRIFAFDGQGDFYRHADWMNIWRVMRTDGTPFPWQGDDQPLIGGRYLPIGTEQAVAEQVLAQCAGTVEAVKVTAYNYRWGVGPATFGIARRDLTHYTDDDVVQYVNTEIEAPDVDAMIGLAHRG